MAWVRLDDQFATNPKLLEAGPLGIAMQAAALCYCNQHLTDGVMHRSAVKTLLDLEGVALRVGGGDLMEVYDDASWALVADALVDAGVWHDHDHGCDRCEDPPRGGFVIHDYLEFQPSRESKEEERAEARERMRRNRERKKAKRDAEDAKRDRSHDVRANTSERSEGVREKFALPRPVPDPTRKEPKDIPTPDGAGKQQTRADEPKSDRRLPDDRWRDSERFVAWWDLFRDVCKGRASGPGAPREAFKAWKRLTDDDRDGVEAGTGDYRDWLVAQDKASGQTHPARHGATFLNSGMWDGLAEAVELLGADPAQGRAPPVCDCGQYADEKRHDQAEHDMWEAEQ